MKRLMLLIATVCLLVAGCNVLPRGAPIAGVTSSQPTPYSLSEMKGLRARIEGADTAVTKAQATYDKECPPGWESQPNPDTDQCEAMKALGQLRRTVLDAENDCHRLVDEYNAQVRRKAPNEGGEVVLGSTRGAAGQVIDCDSGK